MFTSVTVDTLPELFPQLIANQRICQPPASAMSSDTVYNWTWDNLKTLIGGWR